MENSLKKVMLVFAIILLIACMLFAMVACDNDSNKADNDARFVKCPNCNGLGWTLKSGNISKRVECSRCSGKGYIVR